MPLHDNEIPISVELVRELVDSQCPDYSNLPLTQLGASGSTNILFRLGEEFLVRLPRQPGGSSGIGKEERWLPEIRSHLPVEIPEIVFIGKPASGFPERWSITRWIDGELPATCSPDDPVNADRTRLAIDLADVILALRRIKVTEAALADKSLRWYRGRPLVEFDNQFQRNIEKCRTLRDMDLDLDAAASVWKESLTLPGASDVLPDQWYHSDLVAENLLLTEGRLTAVLDFGGLAIGDPTIDLHGAWELFDEPARNTFRERLGVDDAEWLRGRAWALAIAFGCFSYYWETLPGRREDRLAMAKSVLADALS